MDDEDRRDWEQDLIRRGLATEHAPDTGFSAFARGIQPGRSMGHFSLPHLQLRCSPSFLLVPTAVPIPTIAEVEDAIGKSLEKMQEQHAFRTKNLEHVVKEIERTERSLGLQREKFQATSNNYEAYQALRVYFDNLGSCFDNKKQALDGIETKFVDVLAETSDLGRSRRRQLSADLFTEIEEGSRASGTQKPANLDEFGRDTNFYQVSLRRSRRDDHQVG